MKVMRWVPFTFLAGLHGFAMFAPYLIAVVTAVHIIRSTRRLSHA